MTCGRLLVTDCFWMIMLTEHQHCPRLWSKAVHVEVEWTVGPIPIGDKKGKEVVLRYVSSLNSGMQPQLVGCSLCLCV